MKVLIIVLIAIVLLAAILWIRARMNSAPISGLKQFARDPEAMKEMGAAFAARDELLARANSLTDEELTNGVEVILSGKRNEMGNWIQVFEQLGSRSEPFLLKGIADPRCESSKASETLKGPSPFESLSRTLARIGSGKVIAILSDWRNSAEDKKREHAILCIAAIGTPEAIKSTSDALLSANAEDRTYARMGIGWAIKYQHVSREFRDATTSAIENVLMRSSPKADYQDGKLCPTLIELDRERGLTILQSQNVLRADHPLLDDILRTLNTEKVALPRTQLQAFIAKAKTETESPWPGVWAESLRALVVASPEEAKAEIELALASADKNVRSIAIEAFRESQHLPDPYLLHWEDDEFSGYAKSVQHILAVRELDVQVKNGGFSQYFFNSGGERCQVALDGLAAMNAKESHMLLGAAMKILGKKGTSPDRGERIESVGKLSGSADEQLDQLETKYYTDPDTLDLCMVRYMERNAEEMRKAKTISPR